MEKDANFWKIMFVAVGGWFGWLIGEFKPTFPLIIVVIIFICYDAYTAFQLDRRVKIKYPDKAKHGEPKFTSFAFGKIITTTIPKRLMLIFLAFLVEHWVFIHFDIPLSYVVTGVICFEQTWSILENESSCRSEEDGHFYKVLQKIMVDKTERHFDINLEDFKKNQKRKSKKGIE